MGNPQSIPVVSQSISLGQVIAGDAEGARRTQEQFSRECAVVSQIRSAVEASMGNNEAALHTQLTFAAAANDTVDSIPGVGHLKGAIHKACGDEAGAQKSFHLAGPATAGAVAGAVLGCEAGGIAGAVALGSAGTVAGVLAVSAMPERLRDGWQCLDQMDADIGQNAATLHTNNLTWCQKFAEDRGYGGFAVWNNVAFFREASAAELRSRLIPGQGVKLYLFEVSASNRAESFASYGRDADTFEAGASLRASSAPPAATRTVTSMHPMAIQFTHDEIADSFRPQGNAPALRLDDAIEGVENGDILAGSFPPLTVVSHQGNFYSLDNRRLFVFRVLASRGVQDSVAVHVVPMNADVVQRQHFDERLGRVATRWESAFTTTNDGEFVRVRGHGSRYSHEQRPGMDDTHLPGRRSGRARFRAAQRRHCLQTLPSPDPFDFNGHPATVGRV
mmetsp:Transcript_154943/g.281776  ORF Transcript_154943/g.281776 Transcript_154943/m.281776 type:complete len:447 (+) Transcript_154943:93-1433(+)